MLIQAHQAFFALKSFRSNCNAELLDLTGMKLGADARRGLIRTIGVELLTRRGKFVGLDKRQASSLSAIVQEMWCCVSLIGIDDDYDENQRSRDYIVHRLARVYCIIEHAFAQSREDLRTREPAALDCGKSSEIKGFGEYSAELERAISVYRAVLARKEYGCSDALAELWSLGSKTYAEGANLIGGAKFGFALSELEVTCRELRYGQEHLDDYVASVFAWLKQSAVGQILSYEFPKRIQDINLWHYWQVCRLKTGCLAKICSLPRLFHIYGDMVQFYETCDPGYLQLFLDDILDIDADTRHGIPNIFHLLVIRQGRLAQICCDTSDNAQTDEHVIYDREMLSNGVLQGSAMQSSSGHGRLTYKDIKSAICNTRSDHNTAPNKMCCQAILRARRIEQCLLNRDVPGAKQVMRDAGVYVKFLEIFKVDQEFVAHSAPKPVRAKARWLPYLLRVYVAVVRATSRVEQSMGR